MHLYAAIFATIVVARQRTEKFVINILPESAHSCIRGSSFIYLAGSNETAGPAPDVTSCRWETKHHMQLLPRVGRSYALIVAALHA